MKFGFDVISDLYIDDPKDFNWDGKPTSLFCLVAGNISSDMITTRTVLKVLSTHYQGVFFIDGALENGDINLREAKLKELTKLCSTIPNVVYLHNNVVVVDGIALIGLNGWFGNFQINSDDEKFQAKCNRYEDIIYLERTLDKLQLHVDVRKIVIISNSVPSKELYYGESPIDDDLELNSVLDTDTEGKIAYWVFGTYKKIVDTHIRNINYLNNPKYDSNPYYPKRIEIEL